MTLLEEIPREPYREGSIPVLETKRLALRAARLEDAKAVAALANDRRIAENTARIPYPYRVTDAEKFIGGANKNGEAAFLITLRDRTVVGACGIMFHHDDAPELGYWLGVPYWGRGYATEAGRAVVKYGFEKCGLNRIFAGHFKHNPASGRVLAKIGMKYEGCMRQNIVKWDEFVDIEVYSILKQEFDSALK